MKQVRTPFLMTDASPDTLTRLMPAKLVFHWKAAAIYTLILGAAIVWLFFSFDKYPAAFAPDHLQAIIRGVCVLPLLIFCFVVIAVQRLAPYGIMLSAVLLATAIALWLDTASASLSYGISSGHGPEWLRTVLMVVTTFGVLLTALFSVLFSYRARQQEQAATERDALTGLLNRAGLLRWYAQLTPGRTCTLVVFDLNGLKLVNDTAGHGAGDAYIRSIGQAAQSILPESGMVGRWGGDEFAAIIPDLPGEGAAEIMDALLGTTPTVNGNMVAFAYGTSTLNTGEPLERPFALADQRMYEHKELQRGSRTQHSREVNAVEEVSRELELFRTAEDLLTLGLPLIATLLRFDAVFYMQGAADRWVITKFHAPTGSVVPLRIVEGTIHPVHEGVTGRAFQEGRSVYSTDYSADPDASPLWVDGGLKTVLATPVRCFGEIVGFIYLASFSTWRSITPQVRRMTETTALRLGHILDLQRTERDVRVTVEGGLLGLGAALEARDLETGGHTQRVVEYATHLGQALALPPDQFEDLRQGAYLHDIGKLVIPDAILLKPGKLDADEWATMKTHAWEGGRIAGRIPTLTSGAVDVIRHHHERWDGTGYPDALSGTAIPLVARIFSVVDVYDALTSERPYKQAWTHEDAVSEIERQAGKQFDPQVIQAFLSLMRDGTLGIHRVPAVNLTT
ncbi:HD domain-containing phosphohydrolase [Deinococcus altitudinis]|uniref:HD domain-containing phosphohydrolase n=1 Tax=Deinococcus altitudinis TaxID=468914 RepID=UPI003892279C